VVTVSNEDAFARARRAAKDKGNLVGISSGAALEVAKRGKGRGKIFAAIIPNGGEIYLSTPLGERNEPM
jgi:cysteine synthase A